MSWHISLWYIGLIQAIMSSCVSDCINVSRKILFSFLRLSWEFTLAVFWIAYTYRLWLLSHRAWMLKCFSWAICRGVIAFLFPYYLTTCFPYLNHIGVSIARTIYSNLLSLPHSGRRWPDLCKQRIAFHSIHHKVDIKLAGRAAIHGMLEIQTPCGT